MTARPDIRLIVVDIDGTLVDDDKNIPPANVRALRAAIERGVHVAIASGRMVPSIEIMERRLDIDCALIAYNGGKVVGRRQEGRPCLAHNPLPVDVADAVREFARREGFLLNFYLEDALYADRSQERNALAALYHRRTGSIYNFIDVRTIAGREPTKLILLAEPDEMEALRAHFAAALDGRVNVLVTDPEYLEFMRIGVDKATALPTLAAHYGVGIEHVMAIGDADNDRLMVRDAGIGVAVANSRPGVLAVADHTTSRTNNEGAVAEAVARWVLDGEEVDFWDD
jgi:hypothetical protein